jgi:hypothetical protein
VCVCAVVFTHGLAFARQPFKKLLYYCTRGTLWHSQKLLHYVIGQFTLSIILLYPFSPIPRIVSTSLIFPFTCLIFPLYSPFYSFFLNLLGTLSTIEAMPQADIFGLVILPIGSHIYSQTTLGCDLPICVSCVSQMTGTNHYTTSWDGVSLTFCLDCTQTAILLLSISK